MTTNLALQLSQVTNRPSSFDHAPRKVKPRTRKTQVLPVIAMWRGSYVTEDGELGTVVDLIAKLPGMRPTLFARLNAADWVASLDEYYTQHPNGTWQWRASTHERDVVRPDGKLMATRVSTVIHFFGWKGRNYHKIIDPVVMYGHRLDTIWPGDEPPLIRLLKWAVSVRDFCADNGWEVRPTTGGISAQALTDRRFYPGARRKVPARTNERTREHMPGNFYQLNVEPSPDIEFTAYYLDQHRAHHTHAAYTPMPDANSLYAYGRFRDLGGVAMGLPDTPFYGLYCLTMKIPWGVKHSWIRKRVGIHEPPHYFVWSNELPHLHDMGFRVTGVIAAWGSRHRDRGLSAYARWAMGTLDQHGDPKWLKQLLLSAYGTLATRPRQQESVFRLAKSGEIVTLLTGSHKLTGKLTRGRLKLEPGVANVLHRGMIEAATRSESAGFAQHLHGQGHRILSIYADAVIVQADDDKKLPEIPEPWRLKRTLNHLQFINQQAFVSGEMTKLPGVGSELRAYRKSHRAGAKLVNVAEAMEMAEYDGITHPTTKGPNHGYAESGSVGTTRQTV